VTDGGRTYTFTVAEGSSFSPPSEEPITAEVYAFSIERALSPVFGNDAPGPYLIDDIEGEAAFRAGKADHISGISVDGDALSITLTKPSPTFLARLASPSFCPVPVGTPLVEGGVGGPSSSERRPTLPSSGPFYVSYRLIGELTILERNPNYAGPRTSSLDAIALREGVDPSTAIGRVESGEWDLTVVGDPSMDPGGTLDETWGPSSDAATNADQRYYATGGPAVATLVLNANRPLFADVNVRRAVALAVSREALVADQGWLKETGALLPDNLPGGGRDPYDLGGDLAAAVRAMGDATGGVATLAYGPDCQECPGIAAQLHDQLAPLGIAVRGRSVDMGDVYSADAPFDMTLTDTWVDYLDGATFLSNLVENDIPPGWTPAGVQEAVRALQGLEGDARTEETAALADRLTTSIVPAIAYGQIATPSYFSPRLGCRVFPPAGYGVDLTSLCLVDAQSAG
jgi:peptide/nickel transport system substrate-binding protein